MNPIHYSRMDVESFDKEVYRLTLMQAFMPFEMFHVGATVPVVHSQSHYSFHDRQVRMCQQNQHSCAP